VRSTRRADRELDVTFTWPSSVWSRIGRIVGMMSTAATTDATLQGITVGRVGQGEVNQAAVAFVHAVQRRSLNV